MGSGFSISCDNVVSSCLDCIGRQPNYALQLQKNLLLLRNDWNQLKRRRDDIKRTIEVEELYQQMKRLNEVEGWILQVEKMEAEVEQVLRDGSEESLNKCLGGCCPKNCKTSYKLGRKVANKLQPSVTDLLSKGNFDVVTHQVSIPPIDERPAEPTTGLESTFDEVWSYMEDEKVGILGLYGMGGVGKTTLLTQINNKLCNSTQGFDVVIWIVVSKTPNLTKVQDDIGDKIGFHGDGWKNKSPDDKAIDILRILKEKKFVLLLDDIWTRFDLIKMGVPLPNPTNKSKVLLTTRSKKVCGDMEAHKRIQVKCLGEKEAWELFQKKVGEEALNAHPDIPELAKEVAEECDGLPLALITIGRAMACKTTPEDWNHAKDLLKRYASDFSGMGDEVFPLLMFSYESLPKGPIRSCFLYCSLYPEDYVISKEEVIDKWICEGFLNKFDDFYKNRNEGHDYISTLIHVSLLEECSPQEIKLHDVIRDMAIWIGCECGKLKDKFFVEARAGLTETPSLAKWEGAERVSLMSNKIVELTRNPKCPNLLTLFLNDNLYHLESISIGFLQSMLNLRVLDLSCNKKLSRLPREICELVTLQYLNLSHTGLKELPMEFHNLIKLKYLNLEYTQIHKISEEMLSSFKELQMLKLDGCGHSDPLWDGLPKTIVKELESLEYLKELAITIASNFALWDFYSSPKLTSITTTLDVHHLKRSRYLDVLFLKDMIRLERLNILQLRDVEEITIKGNETSRIINQNYCFSSSLRIFYIHGCPMLKDATWVAFAQNLEEIYIIGCDRMKTMVGGSEGERPISPFAKLKKLFLSDLPQLETIYPFALQFPCLKEIELLGDFPKLKKLPFNSSSCNSGCGITIKGREEWWNGLEWEDEATRLAFSHTLRKRQVI